MLCGGQERDRSPAAASYAARVTAPRQSDPLPTPRCATAPTPPCGSGTACVRKAAFTWSRRWHSPALGSEFDAFLFAPLGEDRNGLPLSVISHLARMNLDPWQEAGDLAALSTEAAARRLAVSLETLTDPILRQASSRTVVLNLLALLPHPNPGRRPGARSGYHRCGARRFSGPHRRRHRHHVGNRAIGFADYRHASQRPAPIDLVSRRPPRHRRRIKRSGDLAVGGPPNRCPARNSLQCLSCRPGTGDIRVPDSAQFRHG